MYICNYITFGHICFSFCYFVNLTIDLIGKSIAKYCT